MMTTEPFRSLTEVHERRAAIVQRRDAHLQGIRNHWEVLGERDFRRAVVNATFRRVWRAWDPMSTLRTVSSDHTGMLSALVGVVLGRQARSPFSRALLYLFGAVAPMATERLQASDKAQHFLAELKRSWERVKDYVERRREAYQEDKY